MVAWRPREAMAVEQPTFRNLWAEIEQRHHVDVDAYPFSPTPG